jgi:ABC-type bacteriocin/lantibiotic exporter with double-glycine peptidase domain
VKQPKLLVMEEFFTHMPQADREKISDTLTRAENNWTLIAVTNDPILASKCDRILIMEDGKILEEGSFEQIRKSEHFPKVFKTS